MMSANRPRIRRALFSAYKRHTKLLVGLILISAVAACYVFIVRSMKSHIHGDAALVMSNGEYACLPGGNSGNIRGTGPRRRYDLYTSFQKGLRSGIEPGMLCLVNVQQDYLLLACTVNRYHSLKFCCRWYPRFCTGRYVSCDRWTNNSTA